MFPVLRLRQEDCCAFEPSLGFRVSLTLLLSHEKRKVRRKKKRRRRRRKKVFKLPYFIGHNRSQVKPGNHQI